MATGELEVTNILRYRVTYFQFQIPLLVDFYNVNEVSDFRLSFRKFRRRATSKHTVSANDLGANALPG